MINRFVLEDDLSEIFVGTRHFNISDLNKRLIRTMNTFDIDYQYSVYLGKKSLHDDEMNDWRDNMLVGVIETTDEDGENLEVYSIDVYYLLDNDNKIYVTEIGIDYI